MIINQLAEACFETSSDKVEETRSQSLIAAPLMYEGQALGVIAVHADESGAFNRSDLSLLQSFASTATAAIHNAQLHAQVQALAVTDPLTGLFNRRGFFEVAQREFNRTIRNGQKLSAIMIDTDWLKKVNDVYGHDAGDHLLTAVTQCCQKNLRKIDVICRYGGDEFAILLPDTNLSGAIDVAERLHHSISIAAIQTSEGNIHSTASFGVASLCDESPTLEGLLILADQALLHAKHLGRNCLVYATNQQSFHLYGTESPAHSSTQG